MKTQAVCPKCSYVGCQFARMKHGEKLGHYIWAVEHAKLKATKEVKAKWKQLTTKQLDYSQIEDIEFGGIDHRDAPDYYDAFIEAATYKGREMTESELDVLNEDREYVYEKLIQYLY
jgi:hypothetical protein